MSAKNGYFALVLFLFSLSLSFSAFAKETCKLSGKIVLTEETEYVCASGDFEIEPGTVIISNGNFAKIRTVRYDQCIVDNGLTFRSYEGTINAPNGKDGGQLKFEAGCIRGKCASIHNEPYGKGYGGSIVYDIKVGGFEGYDCQDISPEDKVVAYHNRENVTEEFKRVVLKKGG